MYICNNDIHCHVHNALFIRRNKKMLIINKKLSVCVHIIDLLINVFKWQI